MELLTALCSKHFLQRALYSLQKPGGFRLYCQLSFCPLFLWWPRRKVDRKKGKMRKRRNILCCLFFFFLSHIIYIQILGYRLSSKKRQFPCLFVLVLPMENTSCWSFFAGFFLFFMQSRNPALCCLQRTLSPVTKWYLDKNPSPFFSHSDILHLLHIIATMNAWGGSLLVWALHGPFQEWHENRLSEGAVETLLHWES